MHKIEEFTERQKVRAPQCVQEWQAHNHSSESIDRVAAENAVTNFYAMFGYDKPRLVFCKSPFQLLILPSIMQRLRDRLHYKKEYRTKLMHALQGNIDSEQWKILEHSAWELADQELESDNSTVLSTDSYCSLSLGDPFSEKFQKRKSIQSATGEVELNAALRALSARLYSRVKARTEKEFLNHLLTAFSSPLRQEAHLSNALQTYAALRRQCLPFSATDDTDLLDHISAFRSTLWWGFWGNEWIVLYKFIRDEIDQGFFDSENDRQFEVWNNLGRAAFAYRFFEGVCFLSERPVRIRTDDVFRLHSTEGAALEFMDGYSLHSWHGITVPSYVIDESDKITIEDIDSEENSQVRRVKRVLYGDARYLQNSHAQVVDESQFGVLYRKEIFDEEPIAMVKVQNSTAEPDGSFRDYFLRVPPGCQSAKEAVAWTFGLQADEYDPLEET